MHSINVLICILLLAPIGYHGPAGALGDHAQSYNGRKKTNSELHDNYMPQSYYKSYYPESSSKEKSQALGPQIRFKTNEGKCAEGKKTKTEDGELCQREIQTVKEVADKWATEKAKKTKLDSPLKPPDKTVRLDFSQKEARCCRRKGTVLCAECEQCELQVKGEGEGVMLKCIECREVPAEQVAFPSNSRRTLRLP